jgi:tRNA A37 threonylcarbamoyladenosine synthetase subunit TsaC/SUA5/YrdC
MLLKYILTTTNNLFKQQIMRDVAYTGKGVDFIVDVGPRVATQSTVVDMTGGEPEVLRQGKGDASAFEA